MNIVIIFVTLIVIIGLMAASKLQQPNRRRIHNLFIIALILTLGGCFGLVNHIDSTSNGHAPELWSNSLIWVVLFALGIMTFAFTSIISLYLNAKQTKKS